MKAIINGKAGGDVEYISGADNVINIQVLDDAGAVQNLTGDTSLELQVYSNPERSTVIASKAAVVGVAADGHGVVTLADNEVDFEDLNPGSGLSMAIIRTDGSADIYVDAGFTFRVK